ncbi:MAG TPA: hypothetical protein VMH40_15920 [Myxococcaceae bacterium]|nr:hypothetical protein [Myxococcaceae bacterium]
MAPWVDGQFNQHILDFNVTGNYVDIDAFTLPVGSYVIMARTSLYNLAGATVTVFCELQQGQGTSNVLDETDVTFDSGLRTNLAMMATTVVTATGGERLALACTSSVSGTIRSFFSHLAAIQVGTLSTP